MGIRLRLFVTFTVGVIVIIAVIGITRLYATNKSVNSSAIQQTESLATVQADRLLDALERYSTIASGVTSRTKFRQSLQSYNVAPNQADLDSITQIASDAIMPFADAVDFIILGPDDQELSSLNATPRDLYYSKDATVKALSLGEDARPVFDGDAKYVVLTSLISLNDQALGYLVSVFDNSRIEALVADRTGLGQTGEAVIGAYNSGDGLIHLLHEARFQQGTVVTFDPQDTGVAMSSLLTSGQDQAFGQILDYREEPVVASGRFVKEVGWGLVVKFDKSEVEQPIKEFLVSLAVSFAAIMVGVVAVAYFVARSLAAPIVALTNTAAVIAKGKLEHAVPASTLRRRDEVGRLAQAFEHMRIGLKEIYDNLEAKVQERTQRLSRAKAIDDAILSNIGEMLFVTDTQGTVVMANQAFTERTGLPVEQAIGNKVESLFEVQQRGMALAPQDRPIYQALRQHKSFEFKLQDELSLVRGKQRLPIAITVSPVLLGNELIGAVALFRDLAQEQQIDQAKTELISLASHQLRTPLSIINWYVELLLEGEAGKLNSNQLGFANEIQQASLRLDGLVESLLNVSRIDLGTFAINPQSVDLVKLCQTEVNDLALPAKNKSIQMVLNLPPELTISADPSLMSIAMHNYLTNAIKYSPQNSKVSLTCQVVGAGTSIGGQTLPNDSIYIAVADSGIGIPKQEQPKIFSKLFRASNTEPTPEGGNGLGLYMVKSIIETAGGSVWFESKENQGTTFYLALPRSGMQAKKGEKHLNKPSEDA